MKAKTVELLIKQLKDMLDLSGWILGYSKYLDHSEGVYFTITITKK